MQTVDAACEDKLFPMELTIAGAAVTLYANGAYDGDPVALSKAMQTLSADEDPEEGIFAWLILRALMMDRSTVRC